MLAGRPPCSVGDPVSEIETPALTVCLSKVESNLKKMADAMRSYPGVALRPHAKAHKCPALARLQIESGAVGVCCQTVNEAETMVAGGIKDILVTNEIYGRKKLLRLASLAKQVNLAVCVDNERNIEDLSKAAGELGVTLTLVIEVNVGHYRCGTEPEDVARLAKKIAASPHVSFKGLQCYNGMSQHVVSAKERKAMVDATVEKCKIALQTLKDNGFECNYVTGGGTGTFHYDAASGIYDEVQAGSYVMMDVDYCRNLDEDNKLVSEFEQSLFLLSTVQNVCEGITLDVANLPKSDIVSTVKELKGKPINRAILDAGMKAMSFDSGNPVVKEYEHLTFLNLGDEHSGLIPSDDLKVGDQLWLVPGHCDPTVNMHDWLIGVRDGKVETVWPISARGPGI